VNYGPIVELTREKFERELTMNLYTVVFVTQAAVPALLERGKGAIVNFASHAVLDPQPLIAAYTAGKSAVAGFTRALARELAERGIRVNAVAPGTVRTGDNVAQMGGNTNFVELEDVVRTVAFLASDDARGISGAIVPVTGAGSG
jgi:NAD(P)-dependent dehydrogenase (short-subunit alcohol dehydrogenase family)